MERSAIQESPTSLGQASALTWVPDSALLHPGYSSKVGRGVLGVRGALPARSPAWGSEGASRARPKKSGSMAPALQIFQLWKLASIGVRPNSLLFFQKEQE